MRADDIHDYGKFLLAFVMIYMLLPDDRTCSHCDEETLLIRTNPVGRAGFALSFGRVEAARLRQPIGGLHAKRTSRQTGDHGCYAEPQPSLEHALAGTTDDPDLNDWLRSAQRATLVSFAVLELAALMGLLVALLAGSAFYGVVLCIASLLSMLLRWPRAREGRRHGGMCRSRPSSRVDHPASGSSRDSRPA